MTDNDGKSSLHYASQSKAGTADRLVSTLVMGGMDYGRSLLFICTFIILCILLFQNIITISNHY